MSNIRPRGTPVDEFVDASWAALCDLVGPEADRQQMWDDITGGTAGSAPVQATKEGDTAPAPQHGDRATASEVANLSDDDLEKWVPAYRRADIPDEDFASHWRHTSQFAAGQSALMQMAVGADGGGG